ncbi:MAG: hypothetical protein V2A54_15235 [Bacteroidota bacterium]
MKKIYSILALAIIAVTFAACTNYGTKIEFGKSEVFYTDNVTKEEGQKLGDFLQETEYFTGEGASVQLDKEGEKYLVRFVVKEGIDKDESYVKKMASYLTTIQTHLFPEKPLEGHLCDSKFKTLRTVKPNDFGKCKIINKGELFYKNGVTDAEATKLGDFLVKEEFFNGKTKSVQFCKEGSAYVFRMVVRDDLKTDLSYDKDFAIMARQISDGAVNKAVVYFEACDDNFVTVRRIEMSKEEEAKK